MKKIRIGHIGTKHDHSRDKIDCVRKFPDVFEVVGIVENDLAQRRLVESLDSYKDYDFLTEEQLLNANCDCIMVEGFEYDIPYVAKKCVDNGIAVHIDKPAGIDIDVFESTLKTAKKNNIPLQMAYMYRYNPAVKECMEFIKSGKLGEIHSVTAVMNTGHCKEKREWLSKFEGGPMFFLGCHMIDFVYRIQGIPNNITSYLKSSGFNGVKSIDMSTSIFEYDKGTSIIQSNSCEVNGFGRRQLVVCGSEGTYNICPLERPIHATFSDLSISETFENKINIRNIETVPIKCRYDEMMLDFAAMVRGEKENLFPYEYELELQKLILAASGLSVDYKTKIKL